MSAADVPLRWLSFAFGLLPVLAGPWLFGAWEMWWFWPLAAAIFAAVLFFSLRLFSREWPSPVSWRGRRAAAAIAIAWLVFLVYAAVRFAQAEVFMDAERSFLLFLTPFLLGVVIIFGFSAAQLKALPVVVAVNLFALGLYGIINHHVTGSERVLWMPGYPQYILDDRATGSYYCPDHFAGIMELAFAVGLAVVLTRETRGHSKFLAVVLMAAAVWAILLSKSRGGGLTLLAMLAAAVVWSFSQWRPRVQWALRSAAVGLAVIAALALVLAGTSYVERFRKYPWRQIEAMDRYQMIAAALRAWKTAPVFGIGPGMHQNLWPHFAATPDGDPAAGKWPTYPNTTFHSYEVHSDWTQLLEEYGAVGLALFLAAIGVTLSVLLRGRARALRRMRRDGQETGYYWAIQAALLASAGLAFHSLGDFNLQMPATTWLLAALVSVPLAHIVREV